MSILEEPASQVWDLEAHRIPIPPDAGQVQFTGSLTPTEEEQGGFFYFPNFISEDEEKYLTESITGAPKPKWKVLQNRRLQEWGGQVTASNKLIPQAMPDFLCQYPDLVSRLVQTKVFESSKHQQPNHCLVNEYNSGQGIMPHEDGPAYFPAVATVSLGSHALLDIYRYVDEDLQKDFEERMQEFDKQNGVKSTAAPLNGTDKSQLIPKERIEDNVKIVRGARAREPLPVFSILQEPRSLLITTGQVYKNYLHGIAERSQDDSAALAQVANAELLEDPGLRQAVETSRTNGDAKDAGPSLVRETRLSLTFRDVENVSKGAGAMMAFLQGGGGTAKR